MKYFFQTAVIVALVLTSCKNKQQTVINSNEYYTCSMHPQVMQDKPGTCPICHMDLIVVKKTNTAADEIMLNDEQVRLGNIHADTIRNGMIGDKLVFTATLNADETKVTAVNARVTGRIDHLYFKNTGDYVSKGEKIFDLYSEELNNAKQEYITVLEQQQKLDNSVIDYSHLVSAAKTKLQLWGMSDTQIEELARTGNSSPLTSFYAPVSGYITELPVAEGQYVMEGNIVVKLADLSSLWAEAQVYATQFPAIEKPGMATIQIPDLPGKEFTGKIAFINPEIAPDTRINLVRVELPNKGYLLKPGMPAYVIFKNREQKTLTLPPDAVLRNGEMNIVWVQKTKNTFKMKMVETGIESVDRIGIKSGLADGDVVITSGAYLLNSEYIFKKGADAMNEMPGMDMGSHQH